MAYNMQNPYNNMFGMNNNYNLQSLQNQLAQLQAMQGQIQSPIPNQQPQSGVVQSGQFVVVKSVQDMENYPAPINGDPVNIFIEGKGVFYSKKMMNGSTSCQPFSFSPLNNSAPADNEDENAILKMLSGINERLNRLEGNGNETRNDGRNQQGGTGGESGKKSTTSN